MGQIEYPRRFDRRHLELAEGCLIYFWGPNLNREKLVTPPEPVCLISRWLRPDGEARKNRLAIYKELPAWCGGTASTGGRATLERRTRTTREIRLQRPFAEFHLAGVS